VWLILTSFSLGAIEVWGGGFDRAIEAALPRVVKLYGLGVGAQAGYGTGVLVSSDGLVLTVFSLLIDAERIRAVTADGRLYAAMVTHRDANRQLALLQLMAAGDDGADPHRPEEAGPQGEIGPLPFFDLATDVPTRDHDDSAVPSRLPPILRPGDWVVSAGNPFKIADGSEPVSLTHGVFSARTQLDARRKVKEFPYHGDVLVIDAITSNPGAPGSAVVDLEGRFVGMVGREVVSNLTHTHFNYAVPRDVLQAFLEEAANTGSSPADRSPRRPESERPGADPSEVVVDLGIKLVRTGYKRLPPMVDRIRNGSPAARAGIQKDDVIISVNGKNVADVEDYEGRVRFVGPGEPVELLIRRGRNIMSVRVEGVKP